MDLSLIALHLVYLVKGYRFSRECQSWNASFSHFLKNSPLALNSTL